MTVVFIGAAAPQAIDVDVVRGDFAFITSTPVGASMAVGA